VHRFLGGEPLVFAHQGGAREAPSSTMFAIESAIAVGATAIELDVHQSADGILVVCHDPTVDRTTNGSGAIADLTISELEALDNAYWFVPGLTSAHGRGPSSYPFRGRAATDAKFRIARLDDVLESTRGVIVNLDIKQSEPDVVAYEDRLALALREHERTADVIVASFSDRSLAAFRAAAPEVSTSAGAAELTGFVQSVLARTAPRRELTRHVALQMPYKVAGVRLVDERFVLAAHRLGLALHAWTVDEEAEITRLFEIGVDGVMSDRPSVAVRCLRATGSNR
jgi:glycerophosphoryl diester phosphodiesterase